MAKQTTQVQLYKVQVQCLNQLQDKTIKTDHFVVSMASASTESGTPLKIAVQSKMASLKLLLTSHLHKFRFN